MISQRRRWTLWLAVLPLTWALAGCGGDDKPKKGSGGTKTSSGSTGSTGTGEATTDDDDKSKGSGTATAAAPPAGWGTIKGTITFDGDVPAQQFIHKAGTDVKDGAICAKNDMPDERLVVNKDNKGIRWVLVYLAGEPPIHDDLKKASGEVEFGQEFCQFKPHLLAYRVGQKLKITSSDPTGHNTNAVPFKGEPINPLLPAAPPGGKTEIDGPDWKAQTRPVSVKCNVHGWMTAYIMIFDHPYFAVTDENGNFEIKNVPAGKLHLVTWQESHGYGEGLKEGKEVESGSRDGKAIEVTPDGVTEINLKMKITVK